MAYTIPPTGDVYDEYGRRIQLPPVVGAMDNMPLPLTHQTQPIIPPVAVPQQPQYTPPDFSPIKIIPPAPSPTVAARSAMTPPDINDPAFHQGKLRTVLNAIAGGLAGAANPRLGVEVGSYLHDMPYNRAMTQYNVKSKDLDTKIADEEMLFKRAAEEAKLGAQRGSYQSLDINRQRTANVAERKATVAEEETKRKAKRDEIYNKYTQWKMDNPKLSDFQFLNSLGPDEYEDAKAVWDDMSKGKRKSLEQIENEAEARAKGTAKVAVSPLGQQAAKTGATQRAEGSTTGRLTAEATTPLGADQTARVEYGASRAVSDPDNAGDIAKEFKDKREQDRFWTLVAKGMEGKPIPRTLTAPQKTTVSAARTALGHVNTISEMAETADKMGILGPVMGRLAVLEQKVGGVPTLTVQDSGQSVTQPGTAERAVEDKLIGAMVGMQGYLSTFEASAASGTRPSWQLIKVMKEISPNMRMNKAMFDGAVEAARISVNNRLKGIYSPSKEGQDIKAEKPKPKFKITFEDDKK